MDLASRLLNILTFYGRINFISTQQRVNRECVLHFGGTIPLRQARLFCAFCVVENELQEEHRDERFLDADVHHSSPSNPGGGRASGPAPDDTDPSWVLHRVFGAPWNKPVDGSRISCDLGPINTAKSINTNSNTS